MKRSVKLAAVIIIIAAVTAFAILNARKPLQTELIEVKPGTVAQVFKEEGIVETVQDRPVYSLVSGEIISLPVKEGQRVAAGDLLAQVNTKDLEYQLAQLKAQRQSLEGQEKKSFQEIEQQLQQQQLTIEEAKRQLEQSKAEYNRVKTLYDANAVAKTELEAAINKVEQRQNELAQQESRLALLQKQTGTGGNAGTALPAETGGSATKQYYQGLIAAVEAQIQQLQYQVANSRITVPIDGIVQELQVKQGMVVSLPTPLLRLAATSGYEINAYILVEEVLPVKAGMKVTLIQKRKDGDYKFPGTVQAIAPAAVEKVSALGLVERRIKVTIKPEGTSPELRPGYALDVEFKTLKQSDKLAVPKTCLFPYGGGDALWVVRDGRAQIQQVQKGMETDELFVIKQGLKAGDQVIKNPRLEGLEAGKRVNRINENNPQGLTEEHV